MEETEQTSTQLSAFHSLSLKGGGGLPECSRLAAAATTNRPGGEGGSDQLRLDCQTATTIAPCRNVNEDESKPWMTNKNVIRRKINLKV